MSKTIGLLIVLFFSAGLAADMIAPEEKGCGRVKISDDAEVKKMMGLLVGKSKVEKIKDGESTVLITTKQMSLGSTTTIRCTMLKQNGKSVGYFRGIRSNCEVVQSNSAANTGEPAATATK